jgi:predicted  nucleic acid-binding Zn-ribbon protein
MIENLQREKNALLAKNEQHKSQIRRLNEELNKVINELPSDREPLVRENMELRAKVQRSAGILTSIEKKVAAAMNDEDNGDGHTGK